MHSVDFHLVRLELNLVTLDGVYRDVEGIRDDLLVQGGRVDDHVEPRSHVGAHDHAEGLDLGVDVVAQLPSAHRDDVFAHHEPVQVLEGEVGLHVEDDEAAYTDLLRVRSNLKTDDTRIERSFPPNVHVFSYLDKIV